MLVQWLDDCIIKSFIELFTAPPSSCLYCHSVPVFINVSNDSRLSCRCHAVGECNVIISLECQHVHICSTGSGSCRDAWWFCRCEHTTPPCLVSLAENSHGYSLLAFRWTRSKRVFEQYDYIMIIIDNMILPMWNWLHAFIWWRDNMCDVSFNRVSHVFHPNQSCPRHLIPRWNTPCLSCYFLSMRSIAFMSTWEQFKNQIIRHTAWNQYWLIRLVCLKNQIIRHTAWNQYWLIRLVCRFTWKRLICVFIHMLSFACIIAVLLYLMSASIRRRSIPILGICENRR